MSSPIVVPVEGTTLITWSQSWPHHTLAISSDSSRRIRRHDGSDSEINYDVVESELIQRGWGWRRRLSITTTRGSSIARRNELWPQIVRVEGRRR